jgi:hypothetical protein
MSYGTLVRINQLQVRAGLALIELLTTKSLPACQWLLFDAIGLEGAIISTDKHFEPYDAIRLWTEVIGDPPIEQRGSILIATGRYHSVPITVYTKVRVSSTVLDGSLSHDEPSSH